MIPVLCGFLFWSASPHLPEITPYLHWFRSLYKISFLALARFYVICVNYIYLHGLQFRATLFTFVTRSLMSYYLNLQSIKPCWQFTKPRGNSGRTAALTSDRHRRISWLLGTWLFSFTMVCFVCSLVCFYHKVRTTYNSCTCLHKSVWNTLMLSSFTIHPDLPIL